MGVVCVLCLTVVPLPPAENPFAVKINNNNNKIIISQQHLRKRRASLLYSYLMPLLKNCCKICE
jgi:hypothetical protein